MANEAEIINNPDSTPGAVSTGYQAQNTNIVSQRAGLDLSNVTGGVGNATLEISGPIDVNGVMYDIKSAVIFTPPSAGRYYITLNGAGPANLTPTLGTSAGTFDALKNARYDASNYRVLNWVIYFDGTNCYANRLITPENEYNYIPDLDQPEETWISTPTTWTAKYSKYYTIYVTGSGGDGGGVSTTTASSGGGGGGATGIKRLYIESGDVWTATFSATAGQSTSFSNGVTTLTAKNGSNAGAGSSAGGNGADGGDSTSGCDTTLIGGNGFAGLIPDPGGTYPKVVISGFGGSSFWGSGAKNSFIIFNSAGSQSAAGRDGESYGSGGSGAVIWGTSTARSGGSGSVGIVRIIG